ncbi:hypothetical protein Emed_006211 [Eimeria media]
MSRRKDMGPGAHDDSMLMIPPPGFKFIPRYETAKVFGAPSTHQHPGTGVLLPSQAAAAAAGRPFHQQPSSMQPQQQSQQQPPTEGARAAPGGPPTPAGLGYGQQPAGQAEPFAYIQSPVLFDPTLNLSYVATTSFSPANP